MEENKINFTGVKRIDENIYQHGNKFISKNGKLWNELNEWIVNGGIVDETIYNTNILNNLKKEKNALLEVEYKKAQKCTIKQNGNQFTVLLWGKHFWKLERQTFSSNTTSTATATLFSPNNANQFISLKNLSKERLIALYDIVKPISVDNAEIQGYTEYNIAIAQNIEQLNAISIDSSIFQYYTNIIDFDTLSV